MAFANIAKTVFERIDHSTRHSFRAVIELTQPAVTAG